MATAAGWIGVESTEAKDDAEEEFMCQTRLKQM